MSTRKTQPTCAVQIGFHTLLMPAAVGMKVVALLAEAVDCDMHHDSELRRRYEVNGPVNVEYRSVRPEQIRFPQPAKQRRLEYQGD